MITEEDLHDEFLSGMIRSEEPLSKPSWFTDEIMHRIGLIPDEARLKPYKPPVWLKWGIPGSIVLCLIGLVLTGQAADPVVHLPSLTLFEKISGYINSWFSGLNINVNFPNIAISETVIWVMAGGLILTWSFVLLFRFLEKKVRQ
ncbi:MAG: hypothetical protein WCW62_11240 [Bacteroidales bacterium]